MEKSFSIFLDNIKKNMKDKGKSEEEIVRILTIINEKYKNSPIFETITMKDLEDLDFDDYLDIDEPEDKDTDIMAQMVDPTLENDLRAQRIIELQKSYEEKNPFPEEERIGTQDFDEKGVFGRTRLHTAVLNKDLNEISALLDSGANPYIVDNNGFTPYQTANMEGYTSILLLFEQKGILK